MAAFIFWVVLALYMTLGALATISQVGKPRKPSTQGMATATVLIQALFIAGIIYFGIARS